MQSSACHAVCRNLSRLTNCCRNVHSWHVRHSENLLTRTTTDHATIIRTNKYSPFHQPRAWIMAATGMNKLPEAVQTRKDEYLNMDPDQKRAGYKCGEEFVNLKAIPTWKEYFVNQKIKVSEIQKKAAVDESLNAKVSLWRGDITILEIDAIVNAANSKLLGGGGVDGAIHRAAGGDLLNECRVLRGCPEGEAKITGGYKLPSKYVVHTVGPQEENPKILGSCYENTLQLMLENGLQSIAFPCIGTGIYGYPNDKAADIALSTVRRFLEENGDKVERVIFTVFLPVDKRIYENLMQIYFPTT